MTTKKQKEKTLQELREMLFENIPTDFKEQIAERRENFNEAIALFKNSIDKIITSTMADIESHYAKMWAERITIEKFCQRLSPKARTQIQQKEGIILTDPLVTFVVAKVQGTLNFTPRVEEEIDQTLMKMGFNPWHLDQSFR